MGRGGAVIGACRNCSAFDLSAFLAPCQRIGIGAAAVGHDDMICSRIFSAVMILDDISLVEGIHELAVACPRSFSDLARPSVIIARIIDDL